MGECKKHKGATIVWHRDTHKECPLCAAERKDKVTDKALQGMEKSLDKVLLKV